jgi:hypothetical protein
VGLSSYVFEFNLSTTEENENKEIANPDYSAWVSLTECIARMLPENFAWLWWRLLSLLWHGHWTIGPKPNWSVVEYTSTGSSNTHNKEQSYEKVKNFSANLKPYAKRLHPVNQRSGSCPWGDNLRRLNQGSECHSKRGGGNGLTNQNPPLALPTHRNQTIIEKGPIY